MRLVPLSAADEDRVLTVDLSQMHAHVLLRRGREVFADVVRPDRQLTMPAIHQNRELDRLRPAEIQDRVERRPDGPAGEEHVVNEDDDPAVEVGRDRGRFQVPWAAEADVVSVQGDVEGS